MFVLVLAGSGIIVLLGVFHCLLTLRSSPHGGPMMPTDTSVREAMSVATGLGLAPKINTTLWKAWIGFNLSHSVGVVVVGLLIGLPVTQQMSCPVGNYPWLVASLSLPWIYLYISQQYWFAQPTRCITLAGVLILVGIAGQLVTN